MGDLAENLRRLRKEKGMTQEELADILQISFQTISKWERQESYPDIHMLPVMAGFFNISVDELLGVDDHALKEDQEKVLRQWEADNALGKNLENINRMRAALKQYPGNYEMMLKLVKSLEKCQGSREEMERYKKEAIRLSERIIKHCPDVKMRNEVLYNICYSYWNSGNRELAIQQAKKLPRLLKTQENALVMFQDGAKRIQTGQNAVVDLISLLFHQISCMCRESHYTVDEKLELMEKYLQVSQCLFESEDMQEMLHCKAEAYVKMAGFYMEKGDTSKALSSLWCAADQLKISEGAEKKRRKSLLTNAIRSKSVVPVSYKKYWLLQQLEDARFQGIRKEEKYKKLIKTLQAAKEEENELF